MKQFFDQLLAFLQQGIAAIFRFIQMIWTWSIDQINKVFQAPWDSWPLWKQVLLVLVIAAVIFAVYKAAVELWVAGIRVLRAFASLLVAFIMTLPAILVVDRPQTTQCDGARDQYGGECHDKSHKQAREGTQDPYSRHPELHGGFVYGENHCRDDKDQQDLLPKWPTVPRRLEYFVYLVDRPRPDHLDKSEDRSDALLQERQELIEKLLHLRTLSDSEDISCSGNL